MLVRLIGGFLQAAAGVLVGAYGFLAWHRPAPNLSGELAEGFVHGASALLYFLVATPVGWLALWLFCEGILRVLAAAMQQPLGTAPVALARAVWALRPAPKLPDDVVVERDDGFVIDSARDYDWHALTTIELDGALYAATREAGDSDARPHRYRLTPITPEHVVRQKTRYR